MEHSSRVVDSDEEGYLLEEVLVKPDSDIIVMAPHGEQIEMATAAQTEYLASKLEASYWVVKGFSHDDNGFKKWHEPSTEVSGDRFKLLDEIEGNSLGIAFHGLEDEGLYVGGTAEKSSKEKLSQRLTEAIGLKAEIARKGSGYEGLSPKNVVNRYSERSIQIEQGPEIRRCQGDLVIEAVRNFLDDF